MFDMSAAFFCRNKICGSIRGMRSVRICFARAQRPHRAASGDHRLGTHRASDAGATAGRTQRARSCLLENRQPFAGSMSCSCRPDTFSARPNFFLRTAEGSLLYTGDFKLRHGKSAEPAEWRQADTLIMETTYGLPRYRLPPTEQVVEQIVAFCRDTLDEGAHSGPARLLVRQSAGNSLRARRGRISSRCCTARSIR